MGEPDPKALHADTALTLEHFGTFRNSDNQFYRSQSLSPPAFGLIAESARMGRRAFTSNPELPLHIAGRSINREWFELEMPEVWNLMSDQLYFLANAFEFRIFSFVLMHNHFHLLAQAPKSNLSAGMSYFMRETSRQLARGSKRINSSYGGRFFRSELSTMHYYLNVYKYLYRNPVEAGLCARVEDYAYSTLRGKLGLEKTIIPLIEDLTLFTDVEGTLKWLNTVPDKDDWQAVQKALKRKRFEFANDRRTRGPNHLESNLL